MVRRKEIEAEFEFYQDQILKQLQKYHDPKEFENRSKFLTAIANALAAMALYYSSKKVETYSRILAILTVILIMLTAALIWKTWVP
jgi:hypothetical protein